MAVSTSIAMTATVSLTLALFLCIFMRGERTAFASAVEKREYLARLASIYSSLGLEPNQQVNSTAISAMLMDHLNDNLSPKHQKILHEFRLQEFAPSTGQFTAVVGTGSLQDNQIQRQIFRGFADFHQMRVVNVSSVSLPHEQDARAGVAGSQSWPTSYNNGSSFNNGSHGEPVACMDVVTTEIAFFRLNKIPVCSIA